MCVYFPSLLSYTYVQCPLTGDCLPLPLSTHLTSMLYTINTIYLFYTLSSLRLPSPSSAGRLLQFAHCHSPLSSSGMCSSTNSLSHDAFTDPVSCGGLVSATCAVRHRRRLPYHGRSPQSRRHPHRSLSPQSRRHPHHISLPGVCFLPLGCTWA